MFPSLLLAVLPTYHSVGYAATFGLLLIRMCQGVAAGGELVGSMLCAPLPHPLPFLVFLSHSAPCLRVGLSPLF